MKVCKMFRKHKDSLTASEESRSSTSSSASAGNQTSSSIMSPPIQPQLSLEDEFTIIKTLAKGRYAKILLAKKGHEKMVLKAIQSDMTSEEEFLREVHTNYFLSPHPNIITSFNVSFLWENSYVFVQEFAPFRDLSRFVKKGGLPVSQVKLVAHQLSNALQFLHSFNLVHGDLKLENILVFKSNLSLIKLCDFGSTRTEGTIVRKSSPSWVTLSPPEICRVVEQENYRSSKATDVWQMGMILYLTLTGSTPWQVADITDPSFCQYSDWLRKRSFRLPDTFKTFTPRLIRLFKRILEPKPAQRYEIREVSKYLGDEWVKCGRSSTPSSTSLIERSQSSTARSSRNNSRHKCLIVESKKQNETVDNLSDVHVDKKLISERVDNWLQTNRNRASAKSY